LATSEREEIKPAHSRQFNLGLPHEFNSPMTVSKPVGLRLFCESMPLLPEINRLSPASLAYIGDAVYELYVRAYYLLPPRRLGKYHEQVVAQVRAEQQAAHLHVLEPDLTETEIEILRRGRNAATGKPKRLSGQIYQQATSLETLIGYLYLQDPQRLNQLLAKLSLEF
jgi:ribonuclease-3 family protein